MKVRITLEYDTDDDSTLEQVREDWIKGAIEVADLVELAKDELSGIVVRFEALA